MAKTFVDSGGFYALADPSDRHHRAAVEAFREAARSGSLVTSDHVVIETWLLIRAHLGRHAAMRFWDALGRGAVTVLGVTSRDFARARAIAAEWSDQAFSIVDCTSFAVIEREEVRRAVAFDSHFRVVRLGKTRRRALELIP